MEIQEEVILGSKEQTSHIVKGKRTKRQRPQSPIPFAAMITSTNSPSDGDDGIVTNWSPPTTSTELQDSTEEEEDMANCLILLAKGQSRCRGGGGESPKQVEEKFNSRRFLEAAATGTGKAGYYVYECKTCNRTFPSFQALGGHRASHKKTKAMAAAAAAAEEKKQFLSSSDEEEAQQMMMKKNEQFSSLSLQLSSNSTTRGLYSSSNNNIINRSNNNKVHECSICGAEFTSGQALGGHMRRHRAPIGNSSTSFSLTPIALEPDHQEQPSNKKPTTHVLSLDLDLNLPAPEDDHGIGEQKFSFAPKQQQQQKQQQQKQQSTLVFSAPTLVDCHY
jgi:DNA-directed RNA polymerase subunit RPC12/RpoP|uniref:C2H2-type domain-containing protein n=1 Tax=Fagus sylvatica TaxID=28930 RepID=A0A2N9IVC4_FAGSY